jgi:purine nucleoside permease
VVTPFVVAESEGEGEKTSDVAGAAPETALVDVNGKLTTKALVYDVSVEVLTTVTVISSGAPAVQVPENDAPFHHCTPVIEAVNSDEYWDGTRSVSLTRLWNVVVVTGVGTIPD